MRSLLLYAYVFLYVDCIYLLANRFLSQRNKMEARTSRSVRLLDTVAQQMRHLTAVVLFFPLGKIAFLIVYLLDRRGVPLKR